MNNNKEYESRICNDGRGAYAIGLQWEDNPHDHFAPEYEMWAQGWREERTLISSVYEEEREFQQRCLEIEMESGE